MRSQFVYLRLVASPPSLWMHSTPSWHTVSLAQIPIARMKKNAKNALKTQNCFILLCLPCFLHLLACCHRDIYGPNVSRSIETGETDTEVWRLYVGIATECCCWTCFCWWRGQANEVWCTELVCSHEIPWVSSRRSFCMSCGKKENNNIAGRSNDASRQSSAVINRALCYSLAFIATYLFPILINIRTFSGSDLYNFGSQWEILNALGRIFFPFQGWFNFIVFI